LSVKGEQGKPGNLFCAVNVAVRPHLEGSNLDEGGHLVEQLEDRGMELVLVAEGKDDDDEIEVA
jgi:hypothetical protein